MIDKIQIVLKKYTSLTKTFHLLELFCHFGEALFLLELIACTLQNVDTISTFYT